MSDSYELEVTLTMPDGTKDTIMIPVTEDNYHIIESIMKQALEERQKDYLNDWLDLINRYKEEDE